MERKYREETREGMYIGPNRDHLMQLNKILFIYETVPGMQRIEKLYTSTSKASLQIC
jgi:hypothetical protein